MAVIPNINGSLVVAACGSKQGIGLNGKLPWPHLSADLKHFAKLTRGGAVLMGSATFHSLPSSSRPLPGRLNIVLSLRSRLELGCPDSVLILRGFDEAEQVLKLGNISRVFVIGGGSIYKQAMQRPHWSRRVFYTQIVQDFDADTFFNHQLEAKDSSFTLASVSEEKQENGVTFRMKEFIRNRMRPSRALTVSPSREHEEMQYLNLVRKIITNGVSKGDRTGVGTLSVFGEQMRFNLRESFPLLTTKRVFWRGVAEELFWFIKGSTDAKLLTEKGVRIWEGNGSKSFLDSRGFTDREEGDLGPVYGFQWRHFGAEYTNKDCDYRGAGKDQLTDVIDTIVNNPNDRRMIISAWNPCATDKMALPPCHLLAQFYVANGELSCQMYQRSCDMGLGVPFNIASYSLLTCLIAKVTGLNPGDFVHVLGDTHVYNNHIEALKEQIERQPRAFPTLTIRGKKDIEDFEFEDLLLDGYNPHKSISMQMAV